MKEGLLWFDNDPRRKLSDKIGQAVTRYQVKFGRRPTVCYLNVAELNGESGEIKGIRLQPASNVLRHHFWIGVENENFRAKAA
ncbi:MAG: hypothetical protein JXM69_09950 [Anaerolineae bacterium]|nr:hypothetical protein [Anaerolineae bacterium]